MPLPLIGDCAVPVPGPRREGESKSKKKTGGAAVVGSMHFGNKGGALGSMQHPTPDRRHDTSAESRGMHAARRFFSGF